MTSPNPRLSLCLIARDSAHTIGQALQSARPFMDEMIVVDTGSTDDTPRIARECGATVFDLRWPDSFAAARNASLEHATGDWIFWMDSDDLLPPASGQELRRRIAGCPERNVAFWVFIEERRAGPNGKFQVQVHAHAKLFPRRDDIRFQFRVHEQVAPAIRRVGLPIRRTTAKVCHVTDRSPAAESARLDRNLRLAYLDLQDHPRSPFVWMSLGTTYLYLAKCAPTAVYFLRRSVAGFRRGSPIQLNALLYLGQALNANGDHRQEEHLYRRALRFFPDDAVLLWRLGILCERSRRAGTAVNFYRTILERGRLRTSAVHGGGMFSRTALRLGRLYLQAGDRARCEQVWRSFLDRQPRSAPVRSALEQLLLSPPPIVVQPQ